MAKDYLKQIEELSCAMENYQHGSNSFKELCPTVDFEGRDEIGILASNIQNLIEKQEKAMEIEQQNANLQLRILDSEKLAKEAQLKFLQSRINPHFLFNSLSLISQTAYLECANQTYELLEAMGAYLRYNLDQFDNQVSIQTEIENLEQYILIQKKRFGGRISFSVLCEEAAKSIMIPSLLLQPLVENAIIHGCGKCKRHGNIAVTIRIDEQKLYICVSDDGQGMMRRELDRVRKMIEEAMNQATSVNRTFESSQGCKVSMGIQNVVCRLCLSFPDRVDIKISSEPGILTKFRITIALR